MEKAKIIIIAVLVLAIALTGYFYKKDSSESAKPLKIGVVTPLTGGVAYWGESTKIGFDLAQQELRDEGINVEFIIEDGQLDPKIALNAAQKLVNIDGVRAIFSEFNPAAISITSFTKDKDVLHLYNAAPVSPLVESDNVYKSYLDYEYSCEKTATLLKNRGVNKVGMLKANLEFGDLCLKGVKKVFKENTYVESYNPGNTDFRTLLTKLASNDVEAIFNISFQPETLTSLKTMDELGIKATFVGLSETITPEIVADYAKALEGSIMFGLPSVDEEFIVKVKAAYPDKTIGANQAIAIAYMHAKQLANALDKCSGDIACAKEKLDVLENDSIIGFTGFQNRIAGFQTLIQEWQDGKFIDITK
ncbi:MAG: ABC transporter substrate-binding protein [Leadbetterella sp.]|nr:ABC transporter substrate-binding protein [Leadbetterella sp.]